LSIEIRKRKTEGLDGVLGINKTNFRSKEFHNEAEQLQKKKGMNNSKGGCKHKGLY